MLIVNIVSKENLGNNFKIINEKIKVNIDEESILENGQGVIYAKVKNILANNGILVDELDGDFTVTADIDENTLEFLGNKIAVKDIFLKDLILTGDVEGTLDFNTSTVNTTLIDRIIGSTKGSSVKIPIITVNNKGLVTSLLEEDVNFPVETDPTVPSWVKNITNTQITNWDTAFGWGDHSLEGYALSSQLHEAVTLGTTNGLSLSGQQLSLSLATTLTNGAMSALDKVKLDSLFNYVHPTYSDGTHTLNGATVPSYISYTNGHITSFTTRTLTLGELGYTGDTNANNYIHPSLTSFDVTTSGLEVINNITSNTEGHITNITKRTFPQSNTTTDGYLSSTDWNIFNNKQDLLISGTNIKTINGVSILGSGNLTVGGVNIKNSGGTSQWITTDVNPDIRFEGTGDTTISFNSSTRTITVNSVAGSGTGGNVTSVFGRQGGIVAQEGDYNISLMGDVDITSLSDGQFLKYNLSTGNWENFTWINPTITLTGDVTGSGTTSITTTLKNSGVTPGTYNNVTVDVKGIVTSASNVAYLTSYAETDPIFTAHVSSGITALQISNWDTAYSWGNHASVGYLTSYINNYVTGGSLSTTTLSLTRSGLTDVTINLSSFDTRYSLTSHNHTIESLSNTIIGTKTANDILLWNSVAWVNVTKSSFLSGYATEIWVQSQGYQTANIYVTGGSLSGTTLTLNRSGFSDVNISLGSFDGRYIQNQYASAQSSSSYWISGNGRVDGAMNIGSSFTSQYPEQLVINATNHTTSRRAVITLGSWQVIDDTSADGTQNFGIYTSTAGFPLIIYKDTGNVEIQKSLRVGYVNDSASIVVRNRQLGSFINDFLVKGYSDYTYVGNYQALDLRFFTSNTARISILTNGKVGIGTTNPIHKIHSYTSGIYNMITSEGDGGLGYIESGFLSKSTNGGRGAGYFTQNSISNWFIGNPYSASDSFIISRQTGAWNPSTAQLSNAFITINNLGYVGIGTSSPTEVLHVVGRVRQTNAINGLVYADTNGVFWSKGFGADGTILTSDSGSDGGLSWISPSNLASQINGSFIQNQTATYQTASFRITGEGRAATLKGITSGNGWVGMTTGTSGNTGYIQFRLANDTRLGYIGFSQTDMIYYAENGADHVFLNGKVGIGTAGPTDNLVVAGDGGTFLKIENTTLAQYRGLKIGNAGGDYAKFQQRLDTGELQIVAGTTGWGGFQTFYTDGTEKMRLTLAGYLGVGTTNPLGKVHIVTTNGITNTASWDSSQFVVGQANNTGGIALSYSTSTGGEIGTLAPNVAWKSLSYRAYDHKFYVNGTTQAFTISISGQVLVNASSTSSVAKFFVNGHIGQNAVANNILKTDATGLLVAASSADLANAIGTGHYIQNQNLAAQTANGWITGNFYANGTITGSSDIRIKTNLTKVSVLEKLENIQLYSYDKLGSRNYGLIAQDIEKEFPFAVTKSKFSKYKDFRHVDFYAISSIALQGVKEVKSEVDELKERVKILENKLKENGIT